MNGPASSPAYSFAAPVRVGVIGLGAMGAPMARHLLRAHGHLTFMSRKHHADLVDAGAVHVATAREVAEASDVVLLMVPDLPEVERVLWGPDGLAAATSNLLIMIGSTSSASGIRELSSVLAERTEGRMRVVDCPVSGGEDGAQAGALSIMIGGSELDAQRAVSVLSACGKPVHLGPLGAGEVAKSCNQLVVAATILALGEASVLAERSGIDLPILWDVLGGGYAGSNLLESRKAKLISGDDSPSGMASYMVKDLRFASDVADATDTRTALLPALRVAFDEIVAEGLGDRDIAVTRRYVANRNAA